MPPLYDYPCQECGHVTTDMCPASKRQDAIPCEKCGVEASYEISGGSTIVVNGYSAANNYSRTNKGNRK